MSISPNAVIEPGSNPVVAAPSALASVLVIDDQEIVCSALKALLEAEGFAVATARSGEEGVELLRVRQIEVAIVDLLMPGMDGIQTIAALKEIDPHVEVIILTGHATVESTIAALRQGACDFLVKPVGMAQLRPALLGALEKRRGEVARMDAHARGVIETERKRAQEAAQESAARLQTIFDGVETGILLIDPETHRIVDANPLALKLVGAPREHVLGALCHKFVCPADEGRCPVTDLEQVVDNSERVLLTITGERLPIIKTVRPVVIAGRHLLLETFVDISARKRAEEALRESEDRYRDLVENSLVLIGTHDVKGRILGLNRAAARLLEAADADEMVGRSLTDYVPPDLQPQFTAYLQTVLHEGHAEGLMVIATPSGKCKIVEYRNTLRRQDPNEPIVRWTGQDVTERIQAEKAQAFLASLVESSQDAIIGKTLEGIIVSWNHGAEELYGYRTEEVVGKSISLLAPPDRTEELAPLLEKVRRGEPISRYETVRVRKDGRLADVSLTISPVRDSTRRITGVVTIARDITERKQAEKQTRLQTAALESAANGITITDREGRILWVNPAFTRLTGYPASEVLGQNPRFLKSGTQDAAFYQRLWNTILSGEVWQGEIVNRRKDGALYTEEMTITPVRDVRGDITHYVAIKQDITERKRAERALEERTAYLNTLIDISPLGIVVLDTEERIQMSNPTFERLFQYSHQEMQGAYLNELIVPKELVSEAESLARQCLSRASVHVTSRRRRKDGALVDMEIYGVPLVMGGEARGLLALYQDITERKRGEQSRWESEQQLKAILDNSTTVIYLKDLAGRYIRVNREFETLFGFKPGHVAGRTDHDVFPKEVADNLWTNDQRVVQERTPLEFEEAVHHNGSVRTYLSIKFPLYDAEGLPYAIAGISTDITERKHAEQALRESEKRYRLLFEHNLAGVLRTTLDGRILDCNQAMAKMAGFDSPQEVLARRVMDFYYSDEDRAIFLERLKAGGYLTNFEMRLRHKDGSPVWMIANMSLTSSTAGSSQVIEGTLVDITERKQTEQALAHERDLLHALMDNLPDYIYFKDPESRFLRINRAHAQALGVSDPIEAVGKTDFDFFPREDAKNYYEDEKKIFQTGQPLTGRVESLRRADGQLRWCSATKVPIQDHQGRITGLVGITHDITERKRTEDELHQSRQMLKSILDTIPQRVFWKDRNLIYLGCNRAFALDAGVQDPAEIIGKTDFDLSWAKTAELYRADDKLVMEQESAKLDFEEILSRPDGSLMWLRTSKLPLQDHEGRVIGVIGTYEDITERKRAEEELRGSNELVRLLLDSIPEAVYGIDMQGKCTFCNPSCLRVLGYQEDADVLGKDMHALLHHTRQDGTPYPVVECHIYEAFRRGRGTHIDDEVLWRRDGSNFPAEYWSRPIHRHGNVIGTVVTFVDITERKRAEAALQESEQRYRLLFSQMIVGFALLEVICDEKGIPIDHRYLEINTAFEKHTGLARDSVVGRTIREVLPGIKPFWIETYGKVGTTGESVHFESYAQPVQRWFEVTAFRLRPGRVAVTFADTTQRKGAEEEMRASEARYRELFENASDIVYTTDLDGRVTSLNRVGQQTLGYSQEEATQLSLWQVVAPKHWETVKQGRDRLLAGERDLTSVVEVTAKDGRPVVIEAKPRLIYKDGKPVGVQAIARDITGRDAAEMELRHAQKLESVGRLASGIAHEINTPIQFVGDNTRFLQESFESFQSLLGKYQELRPALASGTASPELLAELQRVEEESDCNYLMAEVPQALTQTLEGVDRVATIVRAMKEFAHPEGKQMAAADLNKALQSTLTVARNELKYVADVETDFGELPLVVCNVGDLNQVFLNLLVNAAHAIGDVMKGTFAKGKIRVRTQAEGNTVLVSISDTGCGIPEANRSKVFDPFFTTKEVGRGTGQGLAISRTVVVDRHKGTLTFESDVGKGTTFYVRLPVDPGECSQETNVP